MREKTTSSSPSALSLATRGVVGVATEKLIRKKPSTKTRSASPKAESAEPPCLGGWVGGWVVC